MGLKFNKSDLLREWFLSVSIILLALNSSLFVNFNSLTTYYISKIIIMLFIFAILILKNWTNRKIILFIITFIILVLIYYKTKDDKLLFLASFIFCADEVNIKKLIKISLITRIIGVCCTFLLCLVDILPNTIYYRGNTPRFCLGFLQPNLLFANIFYIIIGIIFFRFGKLRKSEVLFYYLISFVFSQITGNRTGFFLLFMILTYILFFSKKEKNILFFKRNWWVLCFVFSIILSVFYTANNKFLVWLDLVTAGRINQANYFLNNYQVNLLGNKIIKMYTSVSYNGSVHILDNLYVNLLIHQGIFATIGVLLSISLMIKNIVRYKYDTIIEYKLLLIFFFIFGVYGLFENSPLDISYNIFLVYISLSLKNRKQK